VLTLIPRTFPPLRFHPLHETPQHSIRLVCWACLDKVKTSFFMKRNKTESSFIPILPIVPFYSALSQKYSSCRFRPQAEFLWAPLWCSVQRCHVFASTPTSPLIVLFVFYAATHTSCFKGTIFFREPLHPYSPPRFSLFFFFLSLFFGLVFGSPVQSFLDRPFSRGVSVPFPFPLYPSQGNGPPCVSLVSCVPTFFFMLLYSLLQFCLTFPSFGRNMVK